jgi:outer membrane protein assembly factor BamD
MNRFWIQRSLFALVAIGLVLPSTGCFRRKKYENPITKETQQPDKVLFDKSVRDIEKGRYEVARITLNTLINTYDTSEYLAKAKLAIADSWFREGGSHGLAQAEAEYKDFILFYPTMEEAAEAQNKICGIHMKQMEKVDRDTTQALRAEQECRSLLTQFPNSKFAPDAEQKLRNIQEVIAGGEFKVGSFYHRKGSHPAAANRLSGLVTQYPLFSSADEALWLQGDSYSRMGNRFKPRAVESYQKIVRDYPLSDYAADAKKKLQEMEADVPEADPVAVARMQYDKENYQKPGMMRRSLGFMARGPDVSAAAKSGTPAMTSMQSTIPVSVPAPAAPAGAAGTTDVTIETGAASGANSSLDKNPDARMKPPTPEGAKPEGAAPAAAAPAVDANEPPPSNRQFAKPGKIKKEKKPKKNGATTTSSSSK